MKALKNIRGLVMGFSLTGTLVISMATCAVASADNAGQLSMTAGDFLLTIIRLNRNATRNGIQNLNLPTIWVFSPQGQLVRIVENNQYLDAFQAEYSTIDQNAPSLTCQHVEEATSTLTKQAWSMGCADNKWVALLLVSSNCKTSCDKHKSVLEQAGQKHQDTLRVKTLSLDFKK